VACMPGFSASSAAASLVMEAVIVTAAAMIRRAASAVRPGGVVAFHEFVFYPPTISQSLPSAALFDQVVSAVNAAAAAIVPSLTAVRAQVVSPPQICGWVVRPK
jgi:hypothetical protein